MADITETRRNPAIVAQYKREANKLRSGASGDLIKAIWNGFGDDFDMHLEYRWGKDEYHQAFQESYQRLCGHLASSCENLDEFFCPSFTSALQSFFGKAETARIREECSLVMQCPYSHSIYRPSYRSRKAGDYADAFFKIMVNSLDFISFDMSLKQVLSLENVYTTTSPVFWWYRDYRKPSLFCLTNRMALALRGGNRDKTLDGSNDDICGSIPNSCNNDRSGSFPSGSNDDRCGSISSGSNDDRCGSISSGSNDDRCSNIPNGSPDNYRNEYEEIFSLVEEAILGDNSAVHISHSIMSAIVKSGDERAIELLGKLLLAAKGQEGLRQAILETCDSGLLSDHVYFIRLILENDLCRFLILRFPRMSILSVKYRMISWVMISLKMMIIFIIIRTMNRHAAFFRQDIWTIGGFWHEKV